jgi:2'-5' RNA ligase
VTLAVDDAAQERLEGLRRAHFPPARNVVPAHVSLFHALPGENVDAVLADAHRLVGEPFRIDVTGVRSLGRGCALVLRSADLLALHGRLAAAWEPWLTRQDRQRYAPHVTVQNKVAPEVARALLAELSASFAPWSMAVTGVHVWRYLGGPWEHVATVPASG